MIRSCTIIVTHSTKFNWAYGLFDSYLEFVDKPHDLYFVFTNEDEALKFKSNLSDLTYYKELILSFLFLSIHCKRFLHLQMQFE